MLLAWRQCERLGRFCDPLGRLEHGPEFTVCRVEGFDLVICPVPFIGELVYERLESFDASTQRGKLDRLS